MLRVPQHERNNVKDIKSPPFVLSLVEGLREHFQQSARIAIAITLDCQRSGVKFAGFLNLFHCPLQSQPHCLQYHSVMPSHSSRSARTALPASMDFCSDGVIMPWMIGTTSDEPHSGQAGGFFFCLSLLCLRAISSLITAGRQFVSLQVTPFLVEPAGAWVQRNVIGRFFVVGA